MRVSGAETSSTAPAVTPVASSLTLPAPASIDTPFGLMMGGRGIAEPDQRHLDQDADTTVGPVCQEDGFAQRSDAPVLAAGDVHLGRGPFPNRQRSQPLEPRRRGRENARQNRRYPRGTHAP